jgi:hypothetical protein
MNFKEKYFWIGLLLIIASNFILYASKNSGYWFLLSSGMLGLGISALCYRTGLVEYLKNNSQGWLKKFNL